MGTISAITSRLDGWISAVTGLGGLRDRRNSYKFKGEPALDIELADSLFNDNWLAARVCEIYPEEALAEGVTVKVSIKGEDRRSAGAKGPELETKIHARLDDLNALEVIVEGATFGRCHGDAFVLLGVLDGLPLEEPLDVTRVKALQFLQVIDRRYLTVRSRYLDVAQSNYDEAEVFEFNPGGSAPAAARQLIHESRLLKFRGARTSRRAFRANNNWHYSVLHRVHAVIRDFDVSWDNASNLLQTASMGLYGVNGLMDIIGSEDGPAQLEKRMQAIDMGRSSARSMIYDKELEEFKIVSQSFTGVPDMLDRFSTRVAAGAGVPVSILFGEAPAGLNATGDQDNKSWARKLGSYQAKELKPQLEILLSVLLAEQGASPESWSIEFEPLDKPTAIEQAALRKAVAETDAIYIVNQVWTPEEVAVNRSGAEGWSADTAIDLTEREKVLEAPAEDKPDTGDVGTVGARVTAVLDLVNQVATKAIPRESGIAILVKVVGMTPDEAEATLDEVGKTFFAEEPDPELATGADTGDDGDLQAQASEIHAPPAK